MNISIIFAVNKTCSFGGETFKVVAFFSLTATATKDLHRNNIFEQILERTNKGKLCEVLLKLVKWIRRCSLKSLSSVYPFSDAPWLPCL